MVDIQNCGLECWSLSQVLVGVGHAWHMVPAYFFPAALIFQLDLHQAPGLIKFLADWSVDRNAHFLISTLKVTFFMVTAMKPKWEVVRVH